jgi:hypothetical protein
VVGRPPQSGDTVSQLLDQAAARINRRAFDTDSVRLPSELQKICQRCLEPDWRRRFGTATEVAAALRSWLARGKEDATQVSEGIAPTIPHGNVADRG